MKKLTDALAKNAQCHLTTLCGKKDANTYFTHTCMTKPADPPKTSTESSAKALVASAVAALAIVSNL